MLTALRFKSTYHYSDFYICVPTTFRSQLSGKCPIGGKYGMLVSIEMLLIMDVFKLI